MLDNSENLDFFAELFSLHIPIEKLEEFLKNSQTINEFFSSFDGYSGLEVHLLNNDKVNVYIRWNNFHLFEKQLNLILNACPLKQWFNVSDSIKHEPILIRRYKNFD